MYVSSAERMSADLILHQMRGALAAPAVAALLAHAESNGWELDAEQISCPVQLVWGSGDKILVPPGAAARFREEWLPQAAWVEIEGAGHCPQLDHPLETAQLILDFAR